MTGEEEALSKKLWIYCLIVAFLIILVQLVDWFLTIKVVEIVGRQYELNPLARPIVEYAAAGFFIKFLAGLVLALFFLNSIKRRDWSGAKFLGGAMTLGMLWVCVNNLRTYLFVRELTEIQKQAMRNQPISSQVFINTMIIENTVAITVFLIISFVHKRWKEVWRGASIIPFACFIMVGINFLAAIFKKLP